MTTLTLRKITSTDKKYFAKWWRDKELLTLTSGQMNIMSNEKLDQLFNRLRLNFFNKEYMILVDDITIGNIGLERRKKGWYEVLITIGEKDYRGKGYGSTAIKMLIEQAKKRKIMKLFLQVRPTNIHAIKAYKKCGFVDCGIVKNLDNKNLPELIRMEYIKQ